MYYFIREDGMQKTDENTFFASETEDGVCILTIDQWQNESKWKDRFGIWHSIDSVQQPRKTTTSGHSGFS